jgi:hypothetical protein
MDHNTFADGRSDVSDEERSSPAPQPRSATLRNLWKRSRYGASSNPTSDDEEQGCFPRRQPGKYYTTTTEEYKIETTVSLFDLFLSSIRTLDRRIMS